MLKTVSKKGVPELYLSNSDEYNSNTPLGWAESLFIVALHDLHKKHSVKETNAILKALRPEHMSEKSH